MGKAIVNQIVLHNKSPREYYSSAYRHLRMFYALCKLKSFSDEDLMNIKLAMWKVHGRYLDLAWRDHFARQISSSTGKGTSHGWVNMLRYHQWNHRQLSFGEFQHVHSEWL